MLLLRFAALAHDLAEDSAGTFGIIDHGAAAHAVACAAEADLDLEAHRSRGIDESLIESCDLILGMEVEHVTELREAYPDHAGRVAAMERAMKLRPDNASVRYSLAMAQFDALDYRTAEKNFKRLAKAGDPEESRFVVLGHYQLGRLYALEGERGRAAKQFRKVLELPDQRDSHQKARDALASTGSE